MSWHADHKIHITWGPEGEKLSPEEKDKYAAQLLVEGQARRDEHDAAIKALEGMPYIAVPIEQLESLYERMLRLVILGQSTFAEIHTLPEAVRALRRAVFEQADFGAVYAGQWLPPHVRKAVREKVLAEEREKSANSTAPITAEDRG